MISTCLKPSLFKRKGKWDKELNLGTFGHEVALQSHEKKEKRREEASNIKKERKF